MLLTILICLFIACIGGVIGWYANEFRWNRKESEWWEAEWALKDQITRLKVKLRYPTTLFTDREGKEIVDD